MSLDRERGLTRGQRVAFWTLLVLSSLAILGWTVVFKLEWPAVSGGDLSAASGLPAALTAAAYLASWVLAIVLAASLRAWGWLVASVLIPVSAVLFAAVFLWRDHERRGDRTRQASFQAAMDQALAEQSAGRDGHG